MTHTPRTPEHLLRENQELRDRLEEAESTIRAISAGEVDAFLISRGADDQVLVLDGVDRPYRLLIEQMHQGAVTVTRDGTIVYANRRFAEMVGAVPSALCGAGLAEFVPEARRPRFAALLELGLERGDNAELALRQAGGAELPVLMTASPLLADVQVLCVVVTDLTQQKAQEHQRELFVREHAAREAAEQTASALRELDRRKDEFLAMLGHELRNPLAPLRNGIQVLNIISSQETVAVETRAMMARQVESLVRLVDDLLDVGRVTQGKIKLKKERADLRDVASRAVEACRPVIEERGHSLEVKLPDGPVPVEADVVRAVQVVVNLLNNAVKFTPRGGKIGLTVEAAERPAEAVVRVRDTGIGLTPEMLTRVFDMFAQADPTLSRVEGGLGIGLTLARRLVEMHGGTLEAFSGGTGLGCEFVVRLPRLSDAGPAARPAARPTSRPSGRRILIVDDNLDAAHSLAVLLGLLGHEVRKAHEGRQALDVAAEFVPEVVLLDIGLPGMSGHEVAREFRSHPAFRGVRLVALTGYGSDEAHRQSQLSGFHHHLVKPLDLATLQSVLADPVPEDGHA